MIRLSSNIKIGSANPFRFVNEIEIVSSWENLTDTATIKIPRKLRRKKDGIVTDVVTSGADALWHRGDPVEINLGYNDKNDLRFTGVITKIKPVIPLEFHCEDSMWTLKQTTIKKKYYATTTLKNLLADILPSSIKFTTEDISLSKFSIEQATVAEVLDYIKKTFGLSAYFRNKELYVGFAYKLTTIANFKEEDIKEFHFQKNVIDYSGLDYIREEDQNLKVTAINIKKNNTRQEITVGDTFGEQRTMYFYDMNESDVKKLATEALQKFKYTGFRGSFTTFLKPFVKHGDAVKLVDPTFADRNGVYLVRKVVTTFGMGGGRQEITLDRKIA